LVVIWIGLTTTGGGDGMGEGVGNTPVYGPPGVGSGDATGLGVGGWYAFRGKNHS
jgi:hypothetical protein